MTKSLTNMFYFYKNTENHKTVVMYVTLLSPTRNIQQSTIFASEGMIPECRNSFGVEINTSYRSDANLPDFFLPASGNRL